MGSRNNGETGAGDGGENRRLRREGGGLRPGKNRGTGGNKNGGQRGRGNRDGGNRDGGNTSKDSADPPAPPHHGGGRSGAVSQPDAEAVDVRGAAERGARCGAL